MSSKERMFRADITKLLSSVEAVFADTEMYLEDRVEAVNLATDKFREKWGDYKPEGSDKKR